MKRIIFPVLALSIPAGILAYVFWSSERKQYEEYQDALQKARSAGLIVSAEDMKRAMPADSDNAAVPLIQAGRKIDLSALKKVSTLKPGPFLAETSEIEIVLRDAATKTQLWLPLDSIKTFPEDASAIRMCLTVGADRAIAFSSQGNMDKAIETLTWTAQIRDLLRDARPPQLALQAGTVNTRIQNAALTIAGRFGKPAVGPMRKLFIKEDLKYEATKPGKSLAGYQMAKLDHLIAEASKGDPMLSPLKDEAMVLALRVAILKQAESFLMTAEMRTAHQVHTRLSDLPSHLNGPHMDYRLIQEISMLDGAVGSRTHIAVDLLKWYWLTCEANGNQPSGLEAAFDVHYNPIKYRKLSDGFVLTGAGRNMVDEKGSGDDRWMSFQGGRFRYKN